VCPIATVWRYAASGAAPWPHAAAVQPRHGGSRAAALQHAARPGATAQRCAALDATPWPDVVAAEPDGPPVRRIAPLPEAGQGEPRPGVAQDEPWRAGVPQVELPPQVAVAFLGPGRASRRSPRSRRCREEVLQRDR
jgi:hypothetical protein